jgi:hypothetical protein
VSDPLSLQKRYNNMIATTKIVDYCLADYCKFVSRLTRFSPPGSISRQFASEARIRYRQYRRSGCSAMRYSAWSAVQIALQSLQKETVR